MSDLTFAPEGGEPLPLYLVRKGYVSEDLAGFDNGVADWAEATGFKGAAGLVSVVRASDGTCKGALIGLGEEADNVRKRFVAGSARAKLPDGNYTLCEGSVGLIDLEEFSLGWLLSGYAFDRYKTHPNPGAELVAPVGIDRSRIEAIARGEALTRDLINTPSSDMGPDELESAARELASRHGASVTTIVGEDLIDRNFPMIHTVGRASPRKPRLIDLRWGSDGPSVTLVGKGVCFDTGGLNLKPGSSMGLMKKDMGGAATVIGLAEMIMSCETPIRLRVLIPAVENAVSGSAFRPGDVLTSRKGLTVEINNTDAEGRLVLADALALAEEEDPDLIVSMATLTGAARVAVGPDLAPFYTDNDAHAAALSNSGVRVKDPVWRMPFWDPYETMIEPSIADLDNAPSGGFAGSITAALFLRRFVETTPYIHFDIYGWQPTAAPARPKGGVGQGARAVFEALPKLIA